MSSHQQGLSACLQVGPALDPFFDAVSQRLGSKTRSQARTSTQISLCPCPTLFRSALCQFDLGNSCTVRIDICLSALNCMPSFFCPHCEFRAFLKSHCLAPMALRDIVCLRGSLGGVPRLGRSLWFCPDGFVFCFN